MILGSNEGGSMISSPTDGPDAVAHLIKSYIEDSGGYSLCNPANPSFLSALCPDFKNVSIVGHYIKDRTRDAQFVIISLRNNMFELADRLVGIYKTDNSTKTVTINPAEFTVSGTENDAPTAAGKPQRTKGGDANKGNDGGQGADDDVIMRDEPAAVGGQAVAVA